jgi:hypothetical protein
MTHFEWITVLLTILTLVLLPATGLLIRGAVKWTRTEDRLSALVTQVAELVEQGKDERAATDRRLRYLEEQRMGRRRKRW